MAQAPYQPKFALVLGTIGMLFFACTLPVTQLVVREIDWWQAWSLRASLGSLGALAIWTTGMLPKINSQQLRLLVITTAGIMFGFPVLVSWAMTNVPAGHGGIVTGLMPLVTAIFSALLFRDHQTKLFWAGGAMGAVLVAAYSLNFDGTAAELYWGDLLLVGAVISAALGYAIGAQLTHALTGAGVVCWANIIAAVITIPIALFSLTQLEVDKLSPAGVGGIFYLGLGSQLTGFFFWYSGLARGGPGRVSQVMLLMPFATLLISTWLLAENITVRDVGYCVAVFICVALAVRQRPATT